MKYVEVDLKKISEKFLLRELKRKKKILTIVSLNEKSGLVNSLYNYGCAEESETWIRCYWTSSEPLSDYCVKCYMIPCYILDKNGKFRYVDIQYDAHNVKDFEDGFLDILDNIEFMGNNYKIFLSKEKGDIGNFGASLEPKFIEEYMKENNGIEAIEKLATKEVDEEDEGGDEFSICFRIN